MKKMETTTAKFGDNMKDLVETMQENKKRYCGISLKLVRRSSYLLYRIGEKTVMPTFVSKKNKQGR